ncbi:MAG: VPLPA-CTERM sorting domain-containing protein [Nitrospira sp.]|nr:VPLPA-CTERM sorting domain-containing protein [Nitrospira sp.]
MNRMVFALAFAMLSIYFSLSAPVHAMNVTQLEITGGAVNYEGKHHAMMDRLLGLDGLLKMGQFQAIGEIVPSLDKACKTYSLFTSGFNGASAPTAVISGSSLSVDLSSLFFGIERGNMYRSWNIGGTATGLFNSDTKEFFLSWERVFNGPKQERQASFFLSGLVHLDAQPVPIPAAAWLFGSGVAGLAVFLRQRRSL